MKRVIELIRVSTQEQAGNDRASIPAQKAINRRTCAQYGLNIVHSIEIADVSGACVLLAPEIQKLIQLMQSPDIHGVVAREFSRLMRPENFSDYALLQAFADSKTVLYLPEGPIDLGNKTGRLLGTIRAAIAGMERTEILERIWSAKEEKRRRGELAQNSIVLPWGVGYDRGRWFYKPEAERVREAYRLFLAGNHSYMQLAKMVGVTPRGMHLIMRNPIWTGWRVIDKKRDSSSTGRYTSVHGRQADRRKIRRAPEDIIRVKVITEPLISEEEFNAVQQIMDRKQSRHWRSLPDRQPRFTYSGFLTCAECGDVIHSCFQRRDYYICKSRRLGHRCSSGYMGREKLEGILDETIGGRLTDETFIHACAQELGSRSEGKDSQAKVKRLQSRLESLRGKKDRILDAYFEAAISREERDKRLSSVDAEIRSLDRTLLEETPREINPHALVDSLAALVEWQFWGREQKRNVLAAMMPDIKVANYEIASVGLNPDLFSLEVSPIRADSAKHELVYLPVTSFGNQSHPW